MSAELETAKDVAANPASWFAAATAAIGWLGNKLYHGIGHRISNAENVQRLANEATWREFERHLAADNELFRLLREHERDDAAHFERIDTASRDRHDEILALIGDVRTDIAGLKQ